MESLLVTGFGPFGDFDPNPSELLVRGLTDYRTVILQVTFAEVEQFIENGIPGDIQSLLMIGVAAKSETMRIEIVARNIVGNHGDATGVAKLAGPIDESAPETLTSSLFQNLQDDLPGCTISEDAGAYLCNYGFFLASLRRPDLRVGLLHIPPLTTVPIATQLRDLQTILDRLATEFP